MDIERADEILNSKGVIDVWHHNDPVWLESIESEKRTVHVTNLNTHETMNLPLSELHEK